MSNRRNMKTCSICGLEAEISEMYPTRFGVVCQGCINKLYSIKI